MMGAPEVVHGLERAGFSRQQAEAITEAVKKATLGPSARPATRDDVADVRTEMESLRTELKAEIVALGAELKEEIASCARRTLQGDRRAGLENGGVAVGAGGVHYSRYQASPLTPMCSSLMRRAAAAGILHRRVLRSDRDFRRAIRCH